jgi:hypothetical protein
MRFRKLRITWSLAWGIVAVLLCCLWVRSYWRAEVIAIAGTELSLVRGDLCLNGALGSPVGIGKAELQYRKYVGGRERRLTMKAESVEAQAGGRSTHSAFVLLFACVMGAASWPPFKRFSLRALLIATTLVAAVLGLIVWLSSH